MASIGKLHIGGSPDLEGNVPRSAMVCRLTRPLKEDLLWTNVLDDWAVSGLRGLPYLVTKSRQFKSSDDILLNGFTALQKGLDLAAADENTAATLYAPGDNYILLYSEEHRTCIKINQLFDLSISMNVSMEVRDKNGNLKPRPKRTPPQWHRSFRYYRLSQTAIDLYEAYRNLYLAFEALAEDFCPRKTNEREFDWVRRSLAELHRNYDLSPFVPEDHLYPSEYLFGTLYEFVRCNLFHARTANTILPFYEVNASKIQDAYKRLLRVWRHIASLTLGLSTGEGVVTHQGYRHWMDKVFLDTPKIVVSDDKTPVTESDKRINPAGGSTHNLQACRYAGEVRPGVVAVDAEERRTKAVPTIQRIGLIAAGTLIAVSDSRPGLTLEGVDHLYVRLNQRLIQGSQPKVSF